MRVFAVILTAASSPYFQPAFSRAKLFDALTRPWRTPILG
jgi:hypothetical protein